MAFTVKDWKDYPDTTTPISQAALEDLETRLSAYVDSRVQGVRQDAGAQVGSTTFDVTVTWPVAFPDTNYTVSATASESISTVTNGALVRQVRSKSTTGCVVRCNTGTQGFTAGQLFIHCVAIHD